MTMANNGKLLGQLKKEAFLKLDEPVVLKNILNNEETYKWKVLDWSLEDLADKLKNDKLSFRVGKNANTQHPQWEMNTSIEHKTLTEFLTEVKENYDSSKWLYFDYKYMHQWFIEKPDILTSFNWHQFGFELDGSHSTMWIGSKGAHTNCHQDSYGCNLVAQVHGRKFWLLFSPKCTHLMEPTRIPYEESTIFSKFNFFAPSRKEIKAIYNMAGYVKIIVLEPRDVLFIPRGWWHYVESLETSLSVNVWLPLQEDCNSRLKESLVHLIVNTIGEDLPKTVNQQGSNLLESIQFIANSLNECKNLERDTKLLKEEDSKIGTTPLEKLKNLYQNQLQLLPNLTYENINIFIKKNDIVKVDYNFLVDEYDDENSKLNTLNILEAVVNAICHPEVMMKVSQILKETLVTKSLNTL